ncbi:hypothetical protein [Rhizocola hellebori]|uniref:hypothetical protein n=1 Tax=Rhizocola hellebori TaxID=1392758 RepID=UPI00194168EE|nr:hypothetical protein [Rhizocola hellebori]
MEHIERESGARFPLYRDTQRPSWTTTARGSWAGGFWVGLLWLRAVVWGQDTHKAVAANWTQRLLPRAEDDTVTRAMTFGYGAAVPHRLCGDATAAKIATAGARAVATSFDPRWGLIPVGTAFTQDRIPRAGVDALAGVVTLLSWAGQTELADRHTARLAALCVDQAGKVCAEVSLAGAPSDVRAWDRGHAWAMLGFAVAANHLGEAHLGVATKTAEWWLTHRPLPDDTSAAAIAAAALLTLPHDRYRSAGLALADRLAGRIDVNGVLAGGHYADLNSAEVIWGTYFAGCVLAVATGSVATLPW